MACDTKQIKQDAFNTIKAMVVGNSSSITMSNSGEIKFDYTKSSNYTTKDAAYKIAQAKAQKVEQWAGETFGKNFSRGWIEVYQDNDTVTAKYTFPLNLAKAYDSKNNLDKEAEARRTSEGRELVQQKLELINTNPSLVKDIYGDEHGSIEELVNGLLSELYQYEEVDNAIDNVAPTIIVPNYNSYTDNKKKLLKRVEKTIDRLYTEKRIDNTKGIAGKISRLTTLKESLEKDIDDFTKASNKLGKVKEFFDKDISLIKELLQTPNLENLFLAKDIFRFIQTSANINDINNTLFKDEPGKTYGEEVNNLISELNSQIVFIEKQINDALDVQFTEMLEEYKDNLEKLYPGKDLEQIKELLLQNLQDISKVESMFFTVDNNLSSEADILGQLLRVEYTRVNEREKAKSQKLIQSIDGLLPGVEAELKKLGYVIKTSVGNINNYNWLYQVDEEGNQQPELIGKFSRLWGKFVYSLNKTYNQDIFEARQAKDWAEVEKLLTNKYNDLNDKVEFVDFSLLHDVFSEGYTSFEKKGTESEAAAYKAEIVSKIGQEEYQDLVERQKNFLDAFEEEKKLLIDSKLKQEGVTSVNDLPDNIKDNLNITLERLNPESFIKAFNEGNKNMIAYTVGTQNNEKPSYLKYNTYIPKVLTNLGNQNNFYDSRFSNLEKNETLYNFWKVARESVKTVNENLIDSNLSQAKNSILFMKRNFRESLTDKNYLDIVKAGFKKMINIKQFIKEQISNRDIDRTHTGEIQLPNNLTNFQTMVSNHFKLTMVRVANILERQVKPSTTISWKGLNPDIKAQMLEVLGVSEVEFLNRVNFDKDMNFRFAEVRQFSQDAVFEQQTFNLPSMLKAQLELSAEHKSRSIAKNRVDVLLQKSKQVLNRRFRTGTDENTENAIWGKERQYAQKRNEYFFKRVVLNDSKDMPWGNISKKLKELSSTNDGKILGNHFYKNYNNEEKKIYYTYTKRIEIIGQQLEKSGLSEAEEKSLINERLELESSLRILGKDYLGSAIFNAAFNKLGILVNMGFSIPVAINNYANGHMMLFSRDGEFWTKGNVNLAWHYVTQNKLRFINPGYKESWKMMGAFIKQLNIIQDGTNELQRAEDNVSFLQKGILHPMYGTELVEWYNQVPGILSMAMDVEVAPGVPLFNGKTFPAHHLVNGVFTLKDEYRTPENIAHYEQINSDKMLEWKQLVNDMIRSLNGDYSKTGVTRIKGGVVGKQVMQFKTWLPEYISSRLAFKQKDIVTGEEKTGFLLSALINPRTTIAASGLTVGTLAAGAMSGPSVLFMLPMLVPVLGVGIALNLIRRNKIKFDVSEIINIRSQLAYIAKAGTLGVAETPVNLIGGLVGKKTLIDLDNSFKGKLSPQESRDLMLLAKHMQFSIGILLLRLIIQKMIGFNDDDEPQGKVGSSQRARWAKQQQEKAENEETYNLLENFLTSRFQELNLANDPVSLASTMGSKGGLENNTTKISKAFYNTANALLFPEDDIITQGKRAGQSKAGNEWRKLALPSPIRGIGQDTWQAGFETWTAKEWQNNDFTDKVFDSDYKIDKKNLEHERKALRQKFITDYEAEHNVKFEELDPEVQKGIKRQATKAAKLDAPNPDRDNYDDTQEKLE